MSDVQYLGSLDQFQSEQVTVSTSAVGLTLAYVNNAQTYDQQNQVVKDRKACVAVLNVVGANGLHLTMDGSTPSATNGTTLAGGDEFTVSGHQKLKDLLMIRSGASDATVNVIYYK